MALQSLYMARDITHLHLITERATEQPASMTAPFPNTSLPTKDNTSLPHPRLSPPKEPFLRPRSKFAHPFLTEIKSSLDCAGASQSGPAPARVIFFFLRTQCASKSEALAPLFRLPFTFAARPSQRGWLACFPRPARKGAPRRRAILHPVVGGLPSSNAYFTSGS